VKVVKTPDGAELVESPECEDLEALDDEDDKTGLHECREADNLEAQHDPEEEPDVVESPEAEELDAQHDPEEQTDMEESPEAQEMDVMHDPSETAVDDFDDKAFDAPAAEEPAPPFGPQVRGPVGLSWSQTPTIKFTDFLRCSARFVSLFPRFTLPLQFRF